MNILIHADGHTAELYHHGIKGMKWGIRRYQNKDGSLTQAGKKHRSIGQVIKDHKTAKKRKKALEKARVTKAKNAKERERHQKALESGRLPVKKMTDEELKAAITRLDNEQKYKQKQLENSTLRRFGNKLVNETIIPAATESGKEVAKKYLTKELSKAMGLDEKKVKSVYDQVKEEAEIAKWKKQTFNDKRDLAESQKRYKQHLDEEKTKKEAQSQVDDYNKRGATQDSVRTGEYSKTKDNIKQDYSDIKTAIKNVPVVMDRPVRDVAKSNNSDGLAFVEGAGGELLRTTNYKDIID